MNSLQLVKQEHWAAHALLTPDQMSAADALEIARGTPGYELMERAGAHVAEAAEQMALALAGHGSPAGENEGGLDQGDGDLAPPRIVMCVGPGNNGGDALVAARLLLGSRVRVHVLMLDATRPRRGDAAIALDHWNTAAARHGAEDYAALTPDALRRAIAGAAPTAAPCIVVDGLLGAGLSRPATGDLGQIIAFINAARPQIQVLSVDVPSGLDGATGQPIGPCVEADRTVTFFRKKPGHLLLPGKALCGEVALTNIGIAPAVLSDRAGMSPSVAAFGNDPALWADLAALMRYAPSAEQTKFASDVHKYTRGAVLVRSGDLPRAGAARLAAHAALRAGAGLVTVAAPSTALAPAGTPPLALMQAPCDTPGDFADLLSDTRLRAVVLGPGAGVTPHLRTEISAALAAPVALVLDADAISVFGNAAGGKVTELTAGIASRTAPVILMPHEGEFSRLAAQLPGGITDLPSKLERARAMSSAIGAIIILKGADTVIAAPDGSAVINDNAPHWLATAGSGDVLSGLLAGLLAQEEPARLDLCAAFKAACAGVWLHGKCGALAGPGAIADDLPDTLVSAMSQLSCSDDEPAK